MKSLRNTGLPALAVSLILLIAATAGQASAQRYSRSGQTVIVKQARNEFVVEGGYAGPLGDLTDDYFTTDQGLGVAGGYEVGARFRHYLSPYLAVAPSFQYVKFGKNSGVADFPNYGDDLGYSISTSVYRYALELQSFLGHVRNRIRPYLTLGVSLNHNRYQDEIEGYYGYRHAVDTLAGAIGIGLQMGAIEMSAVYNYNRFSTDGLPSASGADDYNWDYFVVRAGLGFGRF
jgi:hypothetical protein